MTRDELDECQRARREARDDALFFVIVLLCAVVALAGLGWGALKLIGG